jgi:hypothetical protein
VVKKLNEHDLSFGMLQNALLCSAVLCLSAVCFKVECCMFYSIKGFSSLSRGQIIVPGTQTMDPLFMGGVMGGGGFVRSVGRKSASGSVQCTTQPL